MFSAVPRSWKKNITKTTWTLTLNFSCERMTSEFPVMSSTCVPGSMPGGMVFRPLFTHSTVCFPPWNTLTWRSAESSTEKKEEKGKQTHSKRRPTCESEACLPNNSLRYGNGATLLVGRSSWFRRVLWCMCALDWADGQVKMCMCIFIYVYI